MRERRPLRNQRQREDARLPYGLATGKTSGREGVRYKTNADGGPRFPIYDFLIEKYEN
jgi:hypothetical protein